MWNRVDLKARGKEAFRKNYWASVAVALLSGLVTTVSASSGRNAVDTRKQYIRICALLWGKYV